MLLLATAILTLSIINFNLPKTLPRNNSSYMLMNKESKGGGGYEGRLYDACIEASPGSSVNVSIATSGRNLTLFL